MVSPAQHPMVMVEKVSVPCPNCRVRVRMPVNLRPGKKPRCPKCKVIIRPADVLPPELLGPPTRPIAPGVDPFAETKTRLPDGTARPADPFAETKTRLPDGIVSEADPYAETIARTPDEVALPNDPPPWSASPPVPAPKPAPEPPRKKRPPLIPRPLSETIMALPENLPPEPLEDTALPFPPEPSPPEPLEETAMPLPGEWPPPPPR